MANTILTSIYQGKAFHVLGLFCLMLMIHKGSAREFTVNWGLHNGGYAENYNQWAERNRFQIGDSLVFVYTPNDESVLHVTAEAYKNCTVEAPLAEYKDGHTVVSLSKSGPYYFISGKKENCEKNEKLVVVVLADRSNRSSTKNETSSPPSPSPINPPSPPPSDITPSPAPSAESPPAVTTAETPAPSEESNHKKNSASSVFMGVTGSIGAFFASVLLLAF
ncbi:Plastocyanin-like protein [Corchorus olitorius]|uniref:Plastocyanin-like protein n=1 Tax=Corchorus olitorius TaxID=93759 RepID=A0A1R3KBL6_9ROSI|nr:Plastocyanin-like protein [Corchorus olitorius]